MKNRIGTIRIVSLPEDVAKRLMKARLRKFELTVTKTINIEVFASPIENCTEVIVERLRAGLYNRQLGQEDESVEIEVEEVFA